MSQDPKANKKQILAAANRALRNYGYKVETTGGKFKVDYTHCILQDAVIEAAVLAAAACGHLGKDKLRKEYVAFARERFMTFHGEL